MIRQRRAYFTNREIARNFFNKVKNLRPWPEFTVAWHEMPITKGFVVAWYVYE